MPRISIFSPFLLVILLVCQACSTGSEGNGKEKDQEASFLDLPGVPSNIDSRINPISQGTPLTDGVWVSWVGFDSPALQLHVGSGTREIPLPSGTALVDIAFDGRFLLLKAFQEETGGETLFSCDLEAWTGTSPTWNPFSVPPGQTIVDLGLTDVGLAVWRLLNGSSWAFWGIRLGDPDPVPFSLGVEGGDGGEGWVLSDLALKDGVLAWSAWRVTVPGHGLDPASGEIWACDLTVPTPVAVRVTDDAFPDSSPSLSGDLLAWQRDIPSGSGTYFPDGRGREVYLFQIGSSTQPSRLTSDSVADGGPLALSVGGVEGVVWNSSGTVYFQEVGAPVPTVLASGTPSGAGLQERDGHLVWSGDHQLFLLSLHPGCGPEDVRPVDEAGLVNLLPTLFINGDSMAWEAGTTLGSEVRVLSLSGGGVEVIPSGKTLNLLAGVTPDGVTFVGSEWGRDGEVYRYKEGVLETLSSSQYRDIPIASVGVGNSRTVWISKGDRTRVFATRLDGTRDPMAVSPPGQMASDPDLSGGLVTWLGTAMDGSEWAGWGQVFARDLEAVSPTTVQVTADWNYHDTPVTDGTIIAWRNTDTELSPAPEGSFISYFDFPSRLGTSIRDVPCAYVECVVPRLAAGILTWYGTDGLDDEVFAFDTSTATLIQVTDNDRPDSFPVTDGRFIVWEGEKAAEWSTERVGEIFFFNLQNQGQGVAQLTNNHVDDFGPVLGSGMAAWTTAEETLSYVDLPSGTVSTVPGSRLAGPDYLIQAGQIAWIAGTPLMGDTWDVSTYSPDSASSRQVTQDQVSDEGLEGGGGVIIWKRGDGRVMLKNLAP